MAAMHPQINNCMRLRWGDIENVSDHIVAAMSHSHMSPPSDFEDAARSVHVNG